MKKLNFTLWRLKITDVSFVEKHRIMIRIIRREKKGARFHCSVISEFQNPTTLVEKMLRID